MPALVLGGLRMNLAGDDLQPICFLVIILSLAQMFLLGPTIFYLMNDKIKKTRILSLQQPVNCDVAYLNHEELHNMLVTYVLSSYIFCLVSLVVESILWNISSKGTPTEPEKRSKIKPVLIFKHTIMGPLRLGVVVLGYLSISLARKSVDCHMNDNVDDDIAVIEYSGLVNPGIAAYVFFIIVLISQTIEFGIVFGLLVWKGLRMIHKITLQSRMDSIAKMDDRWITRCLCCCKCSSALTCFLFGGNRIDRSNFGAVGQAMTDYFDDGGSLDIVPSDIIAGLMVLLMKQHYRRTQAQRALITGRTADIAADEWTVKGDGDLRQNLVGSDSVESAHSGCSDGTGSFRSAHELLPSILSKDDSAGSNNFEEHDEVYHDTKPIQIKSLVYKIHNDGTSDTYDISMREILSPDQKRDSDAISEGARFMRYALAMYSWKVYTYSRPCTGLCRLCCINGYRKMKHCKNENVIGDGTGFNETALLQEARIDQSEVELVYAQFHNGIEEAPYCIIIDHAWKSVALVIRGSLSIEDFVLDTVFTPDHLEDVGKECGFDGTGEYCHKGLLAKTQWIYQDLKRHGIVERLLLEDSPKCKDYRLRIAGHSLGAGCAAVLALMLRNKYPDLHCLCFSPPGGLLSEKTATSCRSFIQSFVTNNEVVPRLSIDSMERLRNEVLDSIARIKVSKYDLVRTFYGRKFNGKLSEDMDGLLYPRDNIPDCEFARQLQTFRDKQHARIEERDTPRVKLYPPGKIIYLVKTSQEKSRARNCFNCLTCKLCASYDYIPKWAANDDFTEVIASMSMLTDHFPDKECSVLEQVADSFGIDTSSPPN